MLQRSGSDPLLRTLADFVTSSGASCNSVKARLRVPDYSRSSTSSFLQVAGAPEGMAVTIAYAAERLGLKHNSAVELVDRSVREGLLNRKSDVEDKRRAILHVTPRGRQLLGRLSGDHARELNELGPRLERALRQITAHASEIAEVKAPMKSRPSALRDFTVDGRVMVAHGFGAVIGTGAAGMAVPFSAAAIALRRDIFTTTG